MGGDRGGDSERQVVSSQLAFGPSDQVNQRTKSLTIHLGHVEPMKGKRGMT